jgi:lipid A 3-O-deacylase
MLSQTACHPVVTSLLVLSLTLAAPARANDRVFLAYGASEDVTVVRVGGQRDWGRRWFRNGDWFLGGYWELGAGRWAGDEEVLYELGVTPVFRLQRHYPFENSASPYLEAAVGVHLLSESEIAGEDLSSLVQLGDHLGAGMTFGPLGQFSVVYRFQHISNAGLQAPNPSLNLHLLNLGYRFE